MSNVPKNRHRHPKSRISLELRLIGGGLQKKRLAAGLTQRQLGELVGVSGCLIGNFENLVTKPNVDVLGRLAIFFVCDRQEIWPDWLEPHSLPGSKRSVRVKVFSALRHRVLRQIKKTPSFDHTLADFELIKAEFQKTFSLFISSLSSRERFVLERHYGLDGQRAQTLKEVAAALNLTHERVRAIAANALKKLNHPVRAAAFEQLVSDFSDIQVYQSCDVCCLDCGTKYVKIKHCLLCGTVGCLACLHCDHRPGCRANRLANEQ